MLKTMPRYGFQPEIVDIRDHDFHDGRVVLHTFVRLRRSEAGAQADRAVLQQIDLLAETASVSEHVQAMSDRVSRATADVNSLSSDVRDLRSEISPLRQAIYHPRTPFERLDRRLATWWRRYVRPAK
jgi:hypothetical protein